jgi:hypothetical protein
MQAVLIFIILFLTIAVNLPTSVITRMGFDANILLAALVAVVIAGLISNKNLFLVVLVVTSSVIANMPGDIVSSWGLDQDIVFGVLVALVVLPIGAKVTGR